MKITKLHFILLAVVIAVGGFFIYNYQQERKMEMAVLEEQQKKAVEETRLKLELEEKRDAATKTIAVAGEYWTKGRQEGDDISIGQETLRQAKESLHLDKFEEAETLARQSITEFENAKTESIKYTVKRGDNLWKIARMKKHYGRGAMWTVIWRANEDKIPDFDVLDTRIVLTIPKSETVIKKYTQHRKI